MIFTKEDINRLFDEICIKITEGQSLRAVLREEDMPSRTTFYKWISDNQNRIDQYARATQIRADNIFDEIIEIADESDNDTIQFDIGDGVMAEKVNHENIQRSRLRIDARKWAISKMNPKKYGEKSEIDVTSGGEKLSQETTVTFINARKKENEKE